MSDSQELKGIGFFNIKTGETRYAQLEPQIQAYINSSDLGINASRDQNFGWRLDPVWVKRVRAFRRNDAKMEFLASKNPGQKVSDTQVLYAIYGEQLRAAQERADENENAFEDEYLEKISSKPAKAEGADNGEVSEATDRTSSASEPMQEEPVASSSDKSADSTKKSTAGKKER